MNRECGRQTGGESGLLRVVRRIDSLAVTSLFLAKKFSA